MASTSQSAIVIGEFWGDAAATIAAGTGVPDENEAPLASAGAASALGAAVGAKPPREPDDGDATNKWA